MNDTPEILPILRPGPALSAVPVHDPEISKVLGNLVFLDMSAFRSLAGIVGIVKGPPSGTMDSYHIERLQVRPGVADPDRAS